MLQAYYVYIYRIMNYKLHLLIFYLSINLCLYFLNAPIHNHTLP